jgi:RNase H-fold protein (predicted Holliday junction resolvase)
LRVLSIDPGRDKCGLAVVDARDGVLARGVVPTRVVGTLARTWATAHLASVLVVGGGTGLRLVRPALSEIDLPLEIQPEANTTLRARKRYFEEHPPRGLWRLVPLGLQTPPIPVDDYAAVLIAEDYFARVKQRSTWKGKRNGGRPHDNGEGRGGQNGADRHPYDEEF